MLLLFHFIGVLLHSSTLIILSRVCNNCYIQFSNIIKTKRYKTQRMQCEDELSSLGNRAAILSRGMAAGTVLLYAKWHQWRCLLVSFWVCSANSLH